MKLCHMMGHTVGMITYVQILGGPLGPHKNLGKPKSRKFSLISDNFEI